MRPLPITILCLILFIAIVLGLISVLGSLSLGIFSAGRILWILIANLITLVSVIGLWQMKRWGVYLYLGGYLVGVITFYIFPPRGAELLNNPVLVIIVPLIYSLVIFPYWKRLS